MTEAQFDALLQSKTGPTRHTWADRRDLLGLFRDVPRGRTVLLTLVLLIRCTTPPLVGVALGLTVRGVQRADAIGSLGPLTGPLSLFGVLLVSGHLADAWAPSLTFAAAAAIDGAHRTEVARLASSTLDVVALEASGTHALLREVAADPMLGFEATPGKGATAELRWLVNVAAAVTAALALCWYAWWLVPIVAVPALVNRFLRKREAFGVAARWKWAAGGEAPADVWRRATVGPEAKDIRLFGLADWTVETMHSHILKANLPLWTYAIRLVRTEWTQFALIVAGLVPAYVLAAHSTALGETSVGVLTAVLMGSWSLHQATSSSWDLIEMSGSTNLRNATQELRTALADPDDRSRARLTETANPSSRAARRPGGPPHIVFEDVSFAYAPHLPPVLAAASFEIPAGATVALVGLNGAGKSTLVKLLTQLYRPSSGRILVDGVDLASVPQAVWQSRISAVFQDFIKYESTLEDNIVLGQSQLPTDRDALAAAVAESGLQPVIDRLPRGLASMVSRNREGGVDLSGGQWQQVVLARALMGLGGAPGLLVLDEPTAHLDVNTERETFLRLNARRGTTTTLLITHRLSTTRDADRILFLREGRIEEAGTHEQLMRLDGHYAQMFRIQAERFSKGFTMLEEDS
ncbi:ABC transporter ATP-binding protein [Streptomyces sp. NPDC051639]|uniref:ABC transporter ATP-binding protein n=1 Tax=unclassified Streptomyces TaxID=2593676 RepID=UPI002E34DBBA|nr:ABC transporter ATP-binding protein [Streptomyces sp. NBC_01717]